MAHHENAGTTAMNHNYRTDSGQEPAKTFAMLSSRDRDKLTHRLSILGHSPRSQALWMGRIGDIIDKYWRLGWGSNFAAVGRPRILTSTIGDYFGTKERQARNILAVLRSVGLCYREGRRLVFQWIPGDRTLARARRGEKKIQKKRERRKKKGRRSEAEATERDQRDQRRSTERDQNSAERERKTHILAAVLASLDQQLREAGEKLRSRCDPEKLAAALLSIAAKPAGWTPQGSLGGYVFGTVRRIDEDDVAEAIEKFEGARASKRQREAKRIADQVAAQESSSARRAMLRGAADLPEVDQLWIAERVARAIAQASRGRVSPDNPFELERIAKIRDDETLRAMRLLGVDPPS